jgi:hypothetical protein
MSQDKLPTSCVTPEFRVSFAHVIQPKQNEQNGKLQYSMVMLFPKDSDIEIIKEMARNAVENMWPDEAKRPKGIKSPFRNGDEKGYDGYQGHIFLTASSVSKPKLVDGQRQQIDSEEVFYSGCYARAEINAFAYDKNGNKGVSFGLWKIQKLRDGDKFGGGKPVDEVFGVVEQQKEEVHF